MKQKDLAKEYADLQYKIQQDAPEESPDLSKGVFGHEDIVNAFNAGRESVVENIPELEWREKICRDEHFLEAYALGAYYLIKIYYEFSVACNYRHFASYTSLTAAKQAAKEHYKELIKQALGL